MKSLQAEATQDQKGQILQQEKNNGQRQFKQEDKDPDLLGGIGGQVKSETGEDSTISEIIALRSKVYCYLTTDGHEGKRAKGTTHSAQEMQLDWNTYTPVERRSRRPLGDSGSLYIIIIKNMKNYKII